MYKTIQKKFNTFFLACFEIDISNSTESSKSKILRSAERESKYTSRTKGTFQIPLK